MVGYQITALPNIIMTENLADFHLAHLRHVHTSCIKITPAAGSQTEGLRSKGLVRLTLSETSAVYTASESG